MSIAVAVRGRSEIVLATDSQTSWDARRVPSKNHTAIKVRSIGTSLLATTGWGIYENLLDDMLSTGRAPRLGDSKSIFRFFMRFWKDLHNRYSYVNDQCDRKDSPFGDLDASFLVATRRGIFAVASDMSVTEFDQYYAIGSGADFSLGALHALYRPNADAEPIARRAAEAAIALNVYCGGDVKVTKLRLGR